MPYPNDLVIGVTAKGFDDCVSAVYRSHPKWFKGTTTQSGVSVSWDVTKAPTVAVGPPSMAKWDKATDAGGKTPPAASNTAVLQVTLPAITIQTGSKPEDGVSGVDIVVYMDVLRDFAKFKPIALAADLGDSKLSELNRETLLQLLPELLGAANNALPEFELPKIGGSELVPASRGVVDGVYVALGANLARNNVHTEHGVLDNLAIGKTGQKIWEKRHPCVIAVGPALTEPMVNKAIAAKSDELGLNRKKTYTTKETKATLYPVLKGAAMDRNLFDPVINVYIALEKFKVTVDFKLEENPEFDATTDPDPILIQCEITDLGETEIKVKANVPEFDTRYKAVESGGLNELEKKLNSDHKKDPWKELKKDYEGKTYSFPFSLPLEMKSEGLTVRLKLLDGSGEVSYLVLGADVEAT
ncbi:hypothetical protein ACIQI7_22450 [Kitasatospora sp. NPDC092039]|uniref:hypothetical protein n=1 Tax=Kitasatospora sp. NPDC092039 TaxID=3364086 RepID=UPI00380C0E63